ncbi:LOW QUALITY PROTEIN: hypothetical protein TorRG33x02_188270 [Trema orientale]|uniref:Uncharacterized protein n=1 Tax=Trema orientale TaxID=63057 RepID=A0A2P5EIN5_TREOI|nr:LOW QUALITY PROTEIN: hypothetical protein TorRG33x02_188270 [Trema orientale]
MTLYLKVAPFHSVIKTFHDSDINLT